MADRYTWNAAKQAGYKTDIVPLTRQTIADGDLLKSLEVETFSSRDKYLLDSLNSVDSSARSVYNTVNANSANNWLDEKISGFNVLKVSSGASNDTYTSTGKYASDRFTLEFNSFNVGVKNDVIGVSAFDTFTNSYYNKALRTPNVKWENVLAFGKTQLVNDTNTRTDLDVKSGLLFNTVFHYGRGINFFNSTSAKTNCDNSIRMYDGQAWCDSTYAYALSIYKNVSIKGFSIGDKSFSKQKGITINTPFTFGDSWDTRIADSSNSLCKCINIVNTDPLLLNTDSTVLNTHICNHRATYPYVETVVACNYNLTANDAESFNVFKCNHNVVAGSTTKLALIACNECTDNSTYDLINGYGVIRCANVMTKNVYPVCDGSVSLCNRDGVFGQYSITIASNSSCVLAHNSVIFGASGTSNSYNGAVAYSSVFMNTIMPSGYASFTKNVYVNSNLNSPNNMTTHDNVACYVKPAKYGSYANDSVQLYSDHLYTMTSFAAYTTDESNGVGSVPNSNTYFHVKIKNSPDIKQSMLLYTTADQTRGIYDMQKCVTMYSNVIKNPDEESHSMTLGLGFFMLHNDCGVGNNFMSMYNSSGMQNSITMYNSKARQGFQLAMYDSKVLAAKTLGASIAMWNSTISQDAEDSEIALWNRKVVITDDGFINGMKITQLSNKLNGQYPNEMTVETDVIYIQ